MIFHSIHTITIDRFGLGFKFPSKVKRLPIPLPKKWVDRAFNNLVVANNINTNGEEKDDLISDKYHVVSLRLRVELMDVMYKSLQYSWVIGANDLMLNHYKVYFKHDFDKNGLQSILKEKKKLISKHTALYKKLYPEQTESSPINDDDRFEIFQDQIMNIESYLYPEKIGKSKLYLLPIYINKAHKIMKSKQPK